ncbi:primosomal protein N' (replication factor Y) - superfamily II helicase [uncultured Litoreibacter sp.]|uniref:primosomal protein N' (replication factor Y) - superfamily II helicase n=1 Tax=uncultured Litoreibacter sp. TaxID=1392394 RepID=UPI002606B509|nr:primosomal protein N' (replication factor Y) - superfamily II helicase [uncultured Litoreibacter sp.]
MSDTSQEHRFPCDNCGSDMEFDPGGDQLVCPHCGNTSAMSEGGSSTIRELDFEAAVRGSLAEAEMEETRVSQCPNCAAQVEFDANIHATECPFCATPVVTDTGPNRHIKPKGVLPFVLDERTARKAMTDWLGKRWFAPNGLQAYAKKGRKLDGIYVPYWTYDADTKTTYTGERGVDYQVSKTVVRDGKKQTVMVTKTRWHPIAGRVARDFDDVLVLASTSLPRPYTDALAPWDLSQLSPYSPEYLAGFRAEAYTVALDDGFGEARVTMDNRITRDIKFDIGGDRQRIHTAKTKVSNVTFKHVLLPVWMAAYKYRGETYRFVVNGQTGAVRGQRPYSAMKIAIAVVIGLLVAAAIGYGMAQQ